MIYLGSDHRGFQLKEKIKKWLEEWSCQYEDCGNEIYDEEDDYADFAGRVGEKAGEGEEGKEGKEGENKGILVCGTGIGMDMVVNKFFHIRCGLGFSVEQVKRGRKEDDINCLALPADFVTDKRAKEMIRVFLETKFLGKPKYKRRIQKILHLAGSLPTGGATSGELGGYQGDQRDQGK